jgi:hypothetical protein
LEQLAKGPPPPANGHGGDSADDELPQPTGWVACTTDEILATKTKLYDIVVELPGSHLDNATEKKRPIIKTALGQEEIKATQRDLRRYRVFRQALAPLRQANRSSTILPAEGDDEEREHLLSGSLIGSYGSEDADDDNDEQCVEPLTWSALAYSSFMWWASAGEKDEHLVEEENLDKSLLSDLADVAENVADEQRYKDVEDEDEDEGLGASTSAESTRKDARVEMAVIGYFHRLTKKLFDVSSEIVNGDREEDEDTEFDGVPNIHREDLRSMGLDAWSRADRHFVGAFCQLWYEREVNVDSAGVECCGMRVC